MTSWVVYILRCGDDSLYTGITNNLDKRLKTHRAGKGAKYTRGRLPLTLVTYHVVETKSEALKLEYKVKQMNKDRKIEYLNSFKNNLAVYKPRSLGPSTTINNPNYIFGVDVACDVEEGGDVVGVNKKE